MCAAPPAAALLCCRHARLALESGFRLSLGLLMHYNSLPIAIGCLFTRSRRCYQAFVRSGWRGKRVWRAVAYQNKMYKVSGSHTSAGAATYASGTRCVTCPPISDCFNRGSGTLPPSTASVSNHGHDAAFHPEGRGQGHCPGPQGRARSPRQPGPRRCWRPGAQQGQCAAQGGRAPGQGPRQQGLARCCESLRERGCCHACEALQVVSMSAGQQETRASSERGAPRRGGRRRSDWDAWAPPRWRRLSVARASRAGPASVARPAGLDRTTPRWQTNPPAAPPLQGR